MKRIVPVLASCGLLLLGGCAFDVIRLQQVPAPLDGSGSCDPAFQLRQAVEIPLATGYHRTLQQGTVWQCLGRIAQGQVYRTRDQILTVEGSNVFEANIVVVDGRLVGFHLPVEQSFSPLEPPLPLLMERIEPDTGR